MSQSIQLILTLVIVAIAAFFVLRQIIGFVRGTKSSIGKCCSKGCGTTLGDPAKLKV